MGRVEEVKILEPVSIVHIRGGVCQNDSERVYVIDWDEVNAGEISYGLTAIDNLIDMSDTGQITWEECMQTIKDLTFAIGERL
jgi:hypothetical protein